MLGLDVVVPITSCGSQLCMYPVSQSDGVFVSTGRGTPSAVSIYTCMYIHL